MNHPSLLVADDTGAVFDVPGLSMTVRTADGPGLPQCEELTVLPASSVLFTLPRRAAVGFDGRSGEFVTIREHCGRPVFAVAAFLPPGYVCTRHAAYAQMRGAPRLPLYCYAAAGWRDGRFFAAGLRIDSQRRHSISDASLPLVDRKARVFRKKFPGNRLVAHLADNCVSRYRCPNACNLVLGRWECPVPVSRACNASCLGCISKQPKRSCVPSTQHRLDFSPSVKEIVDYAVPHLARASNPIVSFGQGCEGEPLLCAELIEESIFAIRSRTQRGVINLNTNGSLPAAVERLCKAGLNSMRVSLNSAQPGFYAAYYAPRGYSFDNVRESIAIARRRSVWVSINYLVYPGFTDTPEEISALEGLVRKTGLCMIQTRNLNIDPVWYEHEVGMGKQATVSRGMTKWVKHMRSEFPRVKLGYYNPTVRTMRTWAGRHGS